MAAPAGGFTGVAGGYARAYGAAPSCDGTAAGAPGGSGLSTLDEDEALYAKVMAPSSVSPSGCNSSDPGASKACCQYAYCAYKIAYEGSYAPLTPMGSLTYSDPATGSTTGYINLTSFTGAPLNIIQSSNGFPKPGSGTVSNTDPFLNGYQPQTSVPQIYDPTKQGGGALSTLQSNYALAVNAYQNYVTQQNNAFTYFAGSPYNLTTSNCKAYAQMNNEIQNMQNKLTQLEQNNPPPNIQFEQQGPDVSGGNPGNSPASNPGPLSQVSPLPLPCVPPPAPVATNGGTTPPPGYRVCYSSLTSPNSGIDVQNVPDVLPLVISQVEQYLQTIVQAYYAGCNLSTGTPLTEAGLASCTPTTPSAGTVCNMSPTSFTPVSNGSTKFVFKNTNVFPFNESWLNPNGANNYQGTSCGPWSLTTNGTSGQNCQIVGNIGTPGNAETSYYLGGFVAAMDCAWAQIKNYMLNPSNYINGVPQIPLSVTLNSGQPPATPWYQAWLTQGINPIEVSLATAPNLTNIEQCPAPKIFTNPTTGVTNLNSGGIFGLENGTLGSPSQTTTSVISACQIYTMRTALETLAVEIIAQEVVNRAARSFGAFMNPSPGVGVFNAFGSFLAQHASDCTAYSSSCNTAAYQQGCYAPEFSHFFMTGVAPDGSIPSAPYNAGRFTGIWNSGVCK